jgi:hypothetical protein
MRWLLVLAAWSALTSDAIADEAGAGVHTIVQITRDCRADGAPLLEGWGTGEYPDASFHLVSCGSCLLPQVFQPAKHSASSGASLPQFFFLRSFTDQIMCDRP